MPLTLRQMTERILVAMNTSRALVGIPVAALRPLVALAERLLPNPPVTTGLLDLLEIDNVIPTERAPAGAGNQPRPFAPEELLYLQEDHGSVSARVPSSARSPSSRERFRGRESSRQILRESS